MKKIKLFKTLMLHQMKKIRIVLYVITILYGLSIVFLHIDFVYKKPILYFLIVTLIFFDLIIPNLRKKSNRTR